MLAAILDPTERLSELEREPRDAELLRLQHAFVAEAAAHVGRDHAHAALRDPEMLGERGADHVRHLRRGMHHELAGALVPVRHHRLALERIHHLPRRAILAPHHHRRGRGNLRDSLVERGLQEQIVLPLLVHQGGWRIARRNRIDDGRKLIEVELYASGKVFRLRACCRDAHGDGLADEADLVLRQRRIIGRLEAGQSELRLHRADSDVRAHEHRRFGPRRLADGADTGVRQGAAQECHLTQAGERDVADVASQAAQQPGIFLAQDAGADALTFSICTSHSVVPIRSGMDARVPHSAARDHS